MPKKILLADDSITIQKVVELTFSDGDYEVTAVNNGARAIQKLSEMRPDIILSDIIMPEKNGYEVCEFVKSHPEYRNIPVVLLTGTFEPFDPDRADKAGCDAVVTKPFESQSLIHKVEELIEHARSAAPAPPAPSVSAPALSSDDENTPWMEEAPPAAPAAPSPFSSSSSFQPEPGATDAFTHGSDIFGAPGAAKSSPTSEMPFAPPPSPESLFAPPPPADGATRAFPRMSFDDIPAPTTQQVPERAAAPARSPWDEPATPPAGGKPSAFSSMSFDDLGAPPASPAAMPSSSDADMDSPFGASPPAESFSGETRAFPRMSFDELKQAAALPPTAPAPAPPPPAPAPAPEPSPSWNDQPHAFSGETKAFPRMSFDDIQKQMAAPAPAAEDESTTASLWDEPAPSIGREDTPLFSSTPAEEEEEPAPAAAAQQAWPSAVASPATASSPAASSNGGGELTDDQIDRIARRVVQLMSDQVVRNIAWEVIPDLAEMVVKERIKQLEAEG